jgi:hypothetical protein
MFDVDDPVIESPWLWTLAYGFHEDRTPHGYKPTREATSELFSQRFVVRPFTGRDRVMRIDADVWPTPCVDADPISCAQRVAFAGEQKTRAVHDPLQLRKHITRDEILAYHHDRVGLKAMLLRLGRQRQQCGPGED